MFEKVIKIVENDDVFIRDGNKNGYGCGDINDDGHLYYIDTIKKEAYQLPDKYKDTPIILYHPCGGLSDGLIMVSLLGDVDLQYHHTFYDTAGMWGWLDLEGNEVIPPQYVYAMSFWNGRATVCKGKWQVNDTGQYWCDDEQWGIIDHCGQEIVPCRYDEIFDIDYTDRFVLCHKGGWECGCYCVYDIENKNELVTLNFEFDNGYMFNSCMYMDGQIVFDEHLAGEGTDVINVFDVTKHEWVLSDKILEKREFNGNTKLIVNKDGEDIVVF